MLKKIGLIYLYLCITSPLNHDANGSFPTPEWADALPGRQAPSFSCKEPVMFAYLRQLSYRRLLSLLMAASQLFPLPDIPDEISSSSSTVLMRVFPEALKGENHAA